MEGTRPWSRRAAAGSVGASQPTWWTCGHKEGWGGQPRRPQTRPGGQPRSRPRRRAIRTGVRFRAGSLWEPPPRRHGAEQHSVPGSAGLPRPVTGRWFSVGGKNPLSGDCFGGRAPRLAPDSERRRGESLAWRIWGSHHAPPFRSTGHAPDGRHSLPPGPSCAQGWAPAARAGDGSAARRPLGSVAPMAPDGIASLSPRLPGPPTPAAPAARRASPPAAGSLRLGRTALASRPRGPREPTLSTVVTGSARHL